MALALLVEPFKSAWGPFALSIQQDPNAPRTYSKVLTYYCIVGLGLGLALSLFAHEALLILTTPQFIGAERYIWLLALTYLYVELTTLKQTLVRKKNRKLRLLRQLYPEVRVKLFYARDFKALMLKYGRLDFLTDVAAANGAGAVR